MHRLTWRSPEELGLIGAESAAMPPLVTTFEDGLIVAGCKVGDDGTFELTWSVRIHEARDMPEVESFVARVATYIAYEPVSIGKHPNDPDTHD